MRAGWLVRGIHHFGAQAMVVLLAAHLVQTAIFGAYKRPREVNWYLGLGLLLVTLAFALTGYLLPWDQKGYWATRVATNIVGGVPLVGRALEELVVGGPAYGHLTLTRFYALHVGVLPAAALLLLAAHLALFRRHGVTPPVGRRHDEDRPLLPEAGREGRRRRPRGARRALRARRPAARRARSTRPPIPRATTPRAPSGTSSRSSSC